jgi:carbon-monoxide dehydrogenase small subunit
MIAAPPDRVFDLFADIAEVATCLPGASLTAVPAPDRVEGVIRVKLGPISADFRGAARIERDPKIRAGRIVGVGKDQRSGSSTQGQFSYRLVPIKGGAATRVELSIGYSLHGLLAQIARDGLVRDLARRLTAEFASNLNRHLASANRSEVAEKASAVDGVALMLGLLRARLRRIIRIIRR